MTHQRIIKDEELLRLKYMIFDNMIKAVEDELSPGTPADNILDALWQILNDSFPNDISTTHNKN